MTRIPAVLLLLLLTTAGASGQNSFEAVSIRPSNFVIGHMRITMTGGPGTSDPSRVTFTNYVLSDLITKAYGFDISEMSGPDWLMKPGMNSPRFDITAKLPGGATEAQFQLMLRDMLASRFKMAAHRESKDRPIFNLVVAKSGPELKQSVTPSGADTQVFDLALDRIGAARIHAAGVSMETLAARLSRRGNLGCPVRDATGLTGAWDFVLSWQLKEAPPEADSLPALFEALQSQLGLRLAPATGPVETLVIDHLEQKATEN